MAIRTSSPSVFPLGEAHEAEVFLVFVIFIVVCGLALELLILHEKLATDVYENSVDVG